MRRNRNRILHGFFICALTLMATVAPTIAGDTVLSNNSGAENAVFYVEGEPSLVINGFDLTPLGVTLPAAIDVVSIWVETPVVGSAIDVVVYQDANGGSPIDATLAHRQQVTLDQAGLNRIVLDPVAIVTAPVVWVGFYLPVDFRFYSDVSGSSVLTYWAWTSGGTFDLNSLANADVLGPGDGTDPVGIAMEGVARITAELRAPEYEETVATVPLGQQLVADAEQDTSIMSEYADCPGLLFDTEDIEISARGAFTMVCTPHDEVHTPTVLAQPGGQALDMQRAGRLYKLSASIPRDLTTAGALSTLPVPVTHCFRFDAGDLESAVIGEARDIPERWHVLPSVRFGDLVCAEVTNANYISYFLPRTEESPPNVNLVLSWVTVDPHPLQCGLRVSIRLPVVNTGMSGFETASGDITVRIQNMHIASGLITTYREMTFKDELFAPGVRHDFEVGPIYVDTYVHELHRLTVEIDSENEVQELNELDNSWFTEYILAFPWWIDECFNPAWTATPDDTPEPAEA